MAVLDDLTDLEEIQILLASRNLSPFGPQRLQNACLTINNLLRTTPESSRLRGLQMNDILEYFGRRFDVERLKEDAADYDENWCKRARAEAKVIPADSSIASDGVKQEQSQPQLPSPRSTKAAAPPSDHGSMLLVSENDESAAESGPLDEEDRIAMRCDFYMHPDRKAHTTHPQHDSHNEHRFGDIAAEASVRSAAASAANTRHSRRSIPSFPLASRRPHAESARVSPMKPASSIAVSSTSSVLRGSPVRPAPASANSTPKKRGRPSRR